MLIDEMDARKIKSETRSKVVFWVWISLLVLVGVLSFHISREKELKRQYVVQFMQSLDHSAVVYINEQSVDNCDDVIVKLLTLRKRKPHGSRPVEKFEVLITAGEKHLKLVLGSDSEVKTEYWVYLVDQFPAGKEFPSSNDIIGTIDNIEGIQGWLKYKPNQILDPTWTTPILKAEPDSQAGQD